MNEIMNSGERSKTNRILWYIAILIFFGFLMMLGSKLFYGTIVPEASGIGELGTGFVLGFAFIAGAIAFFAPCPFAIFPSYIAYFLDEEISEHNKKKISVLHALRIAGIASLGIFSFYLFVGVVLGLFGTALVYYVNWLKLAIIPLFFIFGVFLLTGKSIPINPFYSLAGVMNERAKSGRHFINMYFYGIVYGIAAAACHLPILLVLALTPILAGNFVVGVATFISYALGASLFFVLFTLIVSFNSDFIIKHLGLYGDRLKKVIALIFILTGIYLTSFYLLTGY